MKRIYSFIIILAAVLFSTSLQARSKIELMGSILIGQTRSLAPIDSVSTTTAPATQDAAQTIEAYNFSGAIYTTFNADLGYVLIEVVSSDTEEVVYSTIVDSGEEDSFIAPNGIDLNSGEYYIRYTTVYGDATGGL